MNENQMILDNSRVDEWLLSHKPVHEDPIVVELNRKFAGHYEGLMLFPATIQDGKSVLAVQCGFKDESEAEAFAKTGEYPYLREVLFYPKMEYKIHLRIGKYASE